jgi:hypothetical protein
LAQRRAAVRVMVGLHVLTKPNGMKTRWVVRRRPRHNLVCTIQHNAAEHVLKSEFIACWKGMYDQRWEASASQGLVLLLIV